MVGAKEGLVLCAWRQRLHNTATAAAAAAAAADYVISPI